MRTNPKTIKLAKIRRHIREATRWYKVDKGMPEMWTSDNYRKSKLVKKGGSDFYYVKSSRAIADIAEKIYNLMEEQKVINVRINDHELKMINSGASLSRLTDNVFLKVYHSNYKEQDKIELRPTPISGKTAKRLYKNKR